MDEQDLALLMIKFLIKYFMTMAIIILVYCGLIFLFGETPVEETHEEEPSCSCAQGVEIKKEG